LLEKDPPDFFQRGAREREREKEREREREGKGGAKVGLPLRVVASSL